MSNWQPIETAPKDGTEVLIWVELHGFMRRAVSHYAGQYADWVIPGIAGLNPTHWMPLPEPPK